MNKAVIDRDALETAYQTMQVKEVMELFGIKSHVTLYRLLDQAGIPRKDAARSRNIKGATRFALSD